MAESAMQIPVQGGVNPLSLSIEEVSRLLTAGGGKRVMVEQVQADIDAGAPVGAGGRMNLMHYAAWLLREVQTQGEDGGSWAGGGRVEGEAGEPGQSLAGLPGGLCRGGVHAGRGALRDGSEKNSQTMIATQ